MEIILNSVKRYLVANETKEIRKTAFGMFEILMTESVAYVVAIVVILENTAGNKENGIL